MAVQLARKAPVAPGVTGAEKSCTAGWGGFSFGSFGRHTWLVWQVVRQAPNPA